jgi:guanosine-3',5'-bis(diphosphate) 3'-pyrophosphohydrolase
MPMAGEGEFSNNYYKNDPDGEFAPLLIPAELWWVNKILEQVKDFAAVAHKGQKRKYADEPYINHPIRVSEYCRRFSNTLSIAAAALLHDVLEDTLVTASEMGSFLNGIMSDGEAKHTMRLVKDLTDVYTHTAYPHMNRRWRKEKECDRLSQIHPDAQTIKYSDILDNSVGIAESGDDFAVKYLQECKAILKRITKGNAEMYKEAMNAVEAALKKLQH